jgi:hypothetical protein
MNEPEGMITVQEAARRLSALLSRRRYLREEVKGGNGQQWS